MLFCFISEWKQSEFEKELGEDTAGEQSFQPQEIQGNVIENKLSLITFDQINKKHRIKSVMAATW